MAYTMRATLRESEAPNGSHLQMTIGSFSDHNVNITDDESLNSEEYKEMGNYLSMKYSPRLCCFTLDVIHNIFTFSPER